jgi:hypothetical protein
MTATAPDAAEQRRKSGDGSKVLRSTSLTTSDTGVMLTSWRSSGAAPWRRKDDDGAEQLRR